MLFQCSNLTNRTFKVTVLVPISLFSALKLGGIFAKGVTNRYSPKVAFRDFRQYSRIPCAHIRPHHIRKAYISRCRRIKQCANQIRLNVAYFIAPPCKFKQKCVKLAVVDFKKSLSDGYCLRSIV